MISMFTNLKIVVISVFIQGVALITFSFWVLFAALYATSIENWSTLTAEVIIYLILGISVLFISSGLNKNSSRAYTPFVLAQLFALIIAWPLIQDNNLNTQLLGYLLGVSGVISLIIGFIPRNRHKFL
jgi:hypothetical protein